MAPGVRVRLAATSRFWHTWRMPVFVPETPASPGLARRSDEPWPPETVPTQGHSPVSSQTAVPAEIDGPGGPEPTRYGDWERRGRCIDF